MPNFNVDDVVADLTNMDQWRNPDEFKAELFLYDFNKRVLIADETNFVVKSSHQSSNSPLFMPDSDLFSKASGLNENKSRVLFNLTPHLTGIGQVLKAQMKAQELENLRASIADGESDDMLQYITALKEAFLTYFDKIHEEITP